MSHYNMQRVLAVKLQNWILNPDREEWTVFCRKIRLHTGYGGRVLEKILKEDYPQFKIEEEVLVDVRE